MAVDRATVARIAKLARIRVPEADLDGLAGELNNILAWIEQLSELDTEGVEPMTSVVEVTLPRRADLVTDGAIPDQVVKNAPEAAHGFFTVPKVVENCTVRPGMGLLVAFRRRPIIVDVLVPLAWIEVGSAVTCIPVGTIPSICTSTVFWISGP